MKAILFTVTVALCFAGCFQKTAHGKQGSERTKQKTVSKSEKPSHAFFLVATVPNSAAQRAFTALKRAGIAYQGAGSLAMGVYVQKQDFPRTKIVLKADARLHSYQVYF